MRIRPRTWFVFSLLLFAAAYWVWTYAEKISASRSVSQAPVAAPVAKPAAPAPAKVAANPAAAKAKSYRVSNTRLSEKQLLRSGHAILLRNALIDTDRPLRLDIPAHLKAKGAPGSYIVQSDGPLDQRFYDRLKSQGVEFVSYIPNNAALVEATPDQARHMANDSTIQAVLPYEPYYKLAAPLLPEAVDQDQPQSSAVNVTTYPGQRDAALAALKALGAQLMGEDSSPFGPTLTVMAPPEALVAIAQMPLAREIEPYAQRRPLNDLTRVTMGVSASTLTNTPNYMNLTGSNVTVNMNDTGVDATHPDFRGPNGTVRLEGAANALADYSGHGTHVAGIIMGNGSMSTNVTNFVPGSIIPGADFRGKATNANLYVQSLDLLVGATIFDAFLAGGSPLSDSAMQTSASTNLGQTNLISNNSWGYEGVTTYDMHAASFDQATRDAQPLKKGEQPLLFVFAAGGQGNGDDYGGSGQQGSIVSPATAKNVLTVGSLDAARFITNTVDLEDQTNSELFFSWTDNSDLVSWFSSCGNVGVGTEGVYGRFKPDVVAPGMFIVSCRASNYIDPTNAVTINTYPFPNQLVVPGQTNVFTLPIPVDTEELVGYVTPNAQSPTPFPTLEIFADSFNPPIDSYGVSNVLMLSNGLTAGDWYVGITAPPGQVQPVAYDVTFYVVETNDLGVSVTNTNGYFTVMSNLNSALKPYYVFEYGTSMAAGAVSGMLALMQEFLQTKMGVATPSPALLKAMVINGSRSAEQQYDFNTQSQSANEQGWGLPNLTNSLPASLTNGSPSLLVIDQSTNNALATGQSQSWVINSTDTNAGNAPLRATLVWTDPPGDPVAGIALVNNLELLITDGSTTNLWLGNDFYAGDTYTEVSTGDLPDVINNVQNIYIGTAYQPIHFPLTVTVLGARVNVNAVTTQTNQIAQDYALVISSDDPASGLTLTSNAPTSAPPANLVTLVTQTNQVGSNLLSAPLLAFAQGNDTLITFASNAVPLLHQRVGANEPNLYTNGILYAGDTPNTNGNVLQWHFFVFNNDQWSATNSASNIAFTTFMPPNLATQIGPRTNGADIDMYVSTDPTLLALNPTAIANSVLNGMASLGRGGNETVIFTNTTPGQVFFIGIKSEDQQAADFGFYGVAQQAPFSQNIGGNYVATAHTPVIIPDTDIGPPAISFAFMVPTSPLMLRNATVQLGLEHGNPSDLTGTLQHDQTQIVLNNNTGAPGGFTNTYNDLNDGTIPGSVDSDGPGSLKNYISSTGAGVWMLTETDNALFQSGQINTFIVTGYPQPLTLAFQVTIGGDQWYDDYVVVPDDATNLNISVSYVSDTNDGPVGIFITNYDNVGFDDYGVTGITPPGGYLQYGLTNVPPLTGGLWYYGIYNYNSAPVTLNVTITFGLSLIPNLVQTYTNSTWTPLTTDGTTNSSQICITSGQQIVDLSVGVRLADTNLDDLVLQLTSPQGGSIVLFENRGGILASNLGLTVISGSTTNGTNISGPSTNYIYTIFTEDTNLADVPIKFAPPPYAQAIITSNVVIYSNGFEGPATTTYTNGQPVAGTGWTVETNEVTVMDDPTVAYQGNNYLALANGQISQTFTTVPGASYEFVYYARSPGLTDWWPADDSTIDLVGPNNGTIPDNDVTYDVGEVGRAFSFSGTGKNPAYTGNEVDFGANAANFGTGNFTVDFWIKQPINAPSLYGILEKRPECQATINMWNIRSGPISWSPDPKPGQLDFAINGNNAAFQCQLPSTKTINDGTFHHVALIRDGATYSYYIDGLLDSSKTAAGIANINNATQLRAGQSVCVSPGVDGLDSTTPLEGDLDDLDLWQRNLSSAEIHAIFEAGSSGKYSANGELYPNFQVGIGGIGTNTIVITNFAGGWKAYTNSFIATNTQTTIELVGNTLGVLLDDVQLVKLAYTNFNNYYLPEEPLTSMIGQNPQGCWTLSVWDTRSDSPADTNGALLSWTLQMTTSSTNVNLIVLTNGLAYSNTIPANSFLYFGVDVPATANYATNILTNASGPMTLFFNQNALPTGTLPGDVTLVTLAAARSGAKTLATQGAPPPLMPGERYYLGLQNTGTNPEAFSLEVNFDVGTNNITALSNSVPISNTNIAANGLDYYSFVVPANAIMATFQLLSPSGPVDLYAREGLPVPGPLDFDYESLDAGTSDQFIVVTTNSDPVPLSTAGANGVVPLTSNIWYLTASNTAAGNATYTILATYVTTNAMTIINLNNYGGYTYTNTNAVPGFPANLLYSFTVTNTNAKAVQFTVTSLTAPGNLELLVGNGVFPTPENFYAGSFNPGMVNQYVSIVTNASLPTLSGSTWYAAVPNTAATANNYSITAFVVTNGTPTSAPLFLGASISLSTSRITMYWSAVPGQSYTVWASSDLLNWTAVALVTAPTSTDSYTDSVPVNSQQPRFFRLTTP